MRARQILPYAEVLLLTIIWGGSFVSSKFALKSFDLFFILMVRYLTSALLLGLLFWRRVKQIDPRTLWHSGIVGIVIYLAMLLQMYGLRSTLASHQSVILVSYTVIVPLLERLVSKKRPGVHVFAAILLIGIGVFLISVREAFLPCYGDMVTLVFAFFYSMQIFLIGIYIKECEPVAFTVNMLFVAGLLSGITWLRCKSVPVGIPAGSSIAGLVYLALLNTAVAFLLQNHAQKYMQSTGVVLIMSMESVFGVIAAYLGLGEEITIRVIAGCVLVVGANLLVILWKK